ncbi:uncharacterized protein C8Q71DRAFT_836440 [Rhodofomes roseus]|uniref:Uncharacterized protein n=1 Tax=Rhodofomes roseus TaxID=34475 RepID=A0ABQ8KDI7_9APHY|nr:uncharacterized protein C8Q71DRAFT_836440 [Rhodofomes roseus]KAH9835704.1 hypothetical protein C8Q71DRAFT_836440 [Rhodofomes roseus]
MPLAIPAIPEIAISLASPEEPTSEPFSPFSPHFAPKSPTISLLQDDDAFRATLLSPPPTLSPRALSPLRPADQLAKGKGLERERFEALLKASRERNTAVGGGRKELDLRKEIAIKAHRSKQVERRALFLSKVQAPPSPTAAVTPKTPPESPAIFHYSLPSPGLDSPIAVFENLSPSELTGQQWVEQVDFRLPGKPIRIRSPALKTAPASKRKVLPSLDQITARLSSHAPDAGKDAPRASARLPSFLQSSRRSPLKAAPPVTQEVEVPTSKARPVLPHDVGRLHFPPRSPAPESKPTPFVIRSPKPCLPPDSPTLCQPPKLQITTTVVPRMNTTSPTEFSESNLLAFNGSADSREDTVRAMLSRLRRRTLPPIKASSDLGVPASPREDDEERKLRRRSAPPELQERDKARTGFEHPVLALPGAF